MRGVVQNNSSLTDKKGICDIRVSKYRNKGKYIKGEMGRRDSLSHP